ncbi:MAG: hypothetical protein C4B59_01555 [Candidatus Methanogaster sp.]|uniref:Uncharacterized protein n=1 Tax=Candidatus Methanogaster sp. TaxID=3386292 RepID=A0AC61L6E0_9EURY|nr:MAG: hypothetical protein C4B59_01555 [ANME-2 cluster archaeon]
MSKSELPGIVQPYRKHPLIKDRNPSDFASIDDEPLNKIIRSVDLILRGLRENYFKGQTTKTKLSAGQFSSSVMIARGWLFLDTAHATNDMDTIIERIYKSTKTTTRPNVVKNIRDSTIPRLKSNGLLELNGSDKSVIEVMPYPISSKLFVLKEFMNNERLFNQQINQFDILGKVQYFPELTSSLDMDASNPQYFARDYGALSEIDVIRNRAIRGRDFTLAKAYLVDNERSYDIWATVLETGEHVRKGLKELMELLGQLGGFASQSELNRMLNRNTRVVNRLIRRVDSIGLAQRSHTAEFEDALSRPIETRVPFNYHQLNNAETMLTLCRSVPEASEMLEKLRSEPRIEEDSLLNEFDPISVGKVRNYLSEIGVITEKGLEKDLWEIAPDKEGIEFLSEVLTIVANSRKVLGEDIEINRKLEDYFKDVDTDSLEKTLGNVEKDVLEEIPL